MILNRFKVNLTLWKFVFWGRTIFLESFCWMKLVFFFLRFRLKLGLDTKKPKHIVKILFKSKWAICVAAFGKPGEFLVELPLEFLLNWLFNFRNATFINFSDLGNLIEEILSLINIYSFTNDRQNIFFVSCELFVFCKVYCKALFIIFRYETYKILKA